MGCACDVRLHTSTTKYCSLYCVLFELVFPQGRAPPQNSLHHDKTGTERDSGLQYSTVDVLSTDYTLQYCTVHTTH